MSVSGRARRLRGGYKWIFLVPTFLGKCASLQHRACVGAKLDCKATLQASGQTAVAGLRVARRPQAQALAVSLLQLGSAISSQNQSSNDTSTSPAVLCERARRPSRLSGDGSLHGH